MAPNVNTTGDDNEKIDVGFLGEVAWVVGAAVLSIISLQFGGTRGSFCAIVTTSAQRTFTIFPKLLYYRPGRLVRVLESEAICAAVY